MNRGQLINIINEKLLGKEAEVGKLSEEELAIFILWKLAEQKNFEPQFFFGNFSEQVRIYKETKKEFEKEPKDEEKTKRKIICVGIAAEYKYIAEKFGLHVTLERMSRLFRLQSLSYENIKDLPQGTHLFDAVHLSNGNILRIDPQREMANIQTKCRPRTIEILQRENTNEEQINIDEILRKLGYIPENGEYTDKYCNMFLKEDSLTRSEIVKRIIDDSLIQQRCETSGVSELYRTYRNIFRKVCEFENVFVIPCYSDIEEGKRKYSICVYFDEDEKSKIWIYSNRQKAFQEINKESLGFFREKGLKFVTMLDGEGLRLQRAVGKMLENETKFYQAEVKNKVLPEEIFEQDDDEQTL